MTDLAASPGWASWRAWLHLPVGLHGLYGCIDHLGFMTAMAGISAMGVIWNLARIACLGFMPFLASQDSCVSLN